ncbi:MAG: hypothetical protein IJF69_03945 [Clostridia bacterium]|nr:hypothetical protein [Clostridia bacterium]
MNEKIIIDAMNYIDDSLIEETEKARNQKTRKLPFSKLSLVAACLLIILLATVLTLPTHKNITADNTHDRGDGGSPLYGSSESIDNSNNDKKENAAGKPSDDIISEGISSDFGFSESVTTTDTSVALVPLRLTVTSFTDNGFICIVANSGGSDVFTEKETLTVLYAEGADIPSDLCEGDTVFVTYSLSERSENKIFAHKIYYTEGETTPAFFGGKK